MIYAVIDTNVFVSALLSHHPDAATVQVVEASSLEGIRPYDLCRIFRGWPHLRLHPIAYPAEVSQNS